MNSKNDKVRRNFIVFCLCSICFALISNASNAQPKDNWTRPEKTYYQILNGFCKYIEGRSADALDKDTIFKNYFLFDYVLSDSSIKRKNARLEKFDGILGGFKRYIDSIGLGNLDAKPIRFFKRDTAFYKPFREDLKSLSQNVFAYFKKEDQGHPLGYIWFDEKSSKIISWILIDQGGKSYFLTFDLL